MKRSHILMSLVASLVIVGCGKNNSDTANSPGNGIDNGAVTGQGTGELMDLTPTHDERRACRNLQRPRFFGTFQKTAIGQNSDLIINIDIRQGEIRLSNTCMFRNGRSATARVTAFASLVGNSLVVHQTKVDRQMLPGSNESCSAMLRQGTYNLTVVGGCMETNLVSPVRTLFMPSIRGIVHR